MKILFIGDKYNKNNKGHPLITSPSLLYLITVIRRLVDNQTIDRYYFCNSVDFKDRKDILKDSKFILSDICICLGRLSEKRIRKLIPDFPVYYIPHPSFWKRFRYSDDIGYIKLIKDIIIEASKNENI